ncbi:MULTISPECIES: transposase [unclassified Chamaesiphon]|uniref:transposase n=1 Tax=unclassified Chamaesiphon TaxID=2620921 RepID=UPI00286B7463|nr:MULTISPECIES: transposase [unclassified Chamaesiphon]
MSSKKITDADKLEIVDLYRQSGDTTASLASRYGVSNSTISRLLKTSIPEAEYEVLIQQKRGTKGSSEAEISIPLVVDSLTSSTAEIPSVEAPSLSIDLPASNPELETLALTQLESLTTLDEILADPIAPKLDTADRDKAIEDTSASRRVRRRSSAPDSQQTAGAVAQIDKPTPTTTSLNTPVETSAVATEDISDDIDNDIDTFATAVPKTPIAPPISRTPVLREILADSKERYANPPPPPAPPVEAVTDESDEDNEPEDVNLLAAMFGEEIADGDDEDDESDDSDAEDWDEESPSSPYQPLLTEDRLHVQVKPLSQATLPRTCYIVIDKFAELIVRPLKDFADLGQLPDKETQQRTLPVFDNHRVAKRFSNQRTQRVIKVPDSRIFYKTTQHLRSKGITCLLVDGNIYSLN